MEWKHVPKICSAHCVPHATTPKREARNGAHPAPIRSFRNYLSCDRSSNHLIHIDMLRWVITFLVIAIIAGLLGFTGVAGDAAYIAKVLFFIFLVLLVLSLIFGKRIWKV